MKKMLGTAAGGRIFIAVPPGQAGWSDTLSGLAELIRPQDINPIR